MVSLSYIYLEPRLKFVTALEMPQGGGPRVRNGRSVGSVDGTRVGQLVSL